MSKKKEPTEYEKARDAYGKLTKDQRSKVLDKVSTKTNAQVGEEAEKAFIDSVNEVKQEEYTQTYGNFWGQFTKSNS